MRFARKGRLWAKEWTVSVQDEAVVAGRAPLLTRQGHQLVTLEDIGTLQGQTLSYTVVGKSAILDQDVSSLTGLTVYDPEARPFKGQRLHTLLNKVCSKR